MMSLKPYHISDLIT